MRPFVGLVLLALFLTPAHADEKKPAEPPHPLPVFRCALDGTPGAIVIPLHDDMWLAYDASTCTLKRAWSGGMTDGAKPTSRGPTYLRDATGGAWFAGLGTQAVRLRPRFLGYRIDEGKVTLRYRVEAGGKDYVVEEQSSYTPADAGPRLLRRFRIDPAPPADAFWWKLAANTRTAHETNARVEEHKTTLHLHPAAGKATTWVRVAFDKEAARRQWQIEESLRRIAEEEEAQRAGKAEEAPKKLTVEPGVSVRVYRTTGHMGKLPELVPGQAPNVWHLRPTIDLRSERKDFGDLKDRFVTHVDGFLDIETPGTYGFRLISDDGSRLLLDGKVVVDHDGLHGPVPKEGAAALTKGRHTLFVEHFEMGGGEQLTLEWRPPGAAAWTLIPHRLLCAPAAMTRPTAPGPKRLVPVPARTEPGDGAPLDSVHPGYDLSDIRPEGLETHVSGMDWLPGGRLAICSRDGSVHVLGGVQGDDAQKVTVKRIAAGLAEPREVRVVDGRFFVLQMQELTELIDRSGDGIVDEYRCVASGADMRTSLRDLGFEGERLPVVWLPDRASSRPVLVRDGPYTGQMLRGTVANEGLMRVQPESVGDHKQGCAFRFTQIAVGFDCWLGGPDGSLYAGGPGRILRLKPNGKNVFDVRSIRAAPERQGFVIEFTQPLARHAGGHRGDYRIEQWRHEPTADYGGPKPDVEPVTVSGASLSEDRRSVFVETRSFNPLREGSVVHIRLGRTVRNEAGERPWSREAWYTLTDTAVSRFDSQRLPPDPPYNQLTAEEHEAGWTLLFDGRTTKGWRGYRKKAVPSRWRVQHGALHLGKEGRGGDIITEAKFQDFELKLEWKIAKGGNSGICYRLTEEHGAMWMTGPEYQVLDNGRHPDGGATSTSAAANYALHAPRFDVTRAPGRWNEARIVVKGSHVEHWLNGWKLLEYQVGSEDWKKRLQQSKFARTSGWGVQPEGHIGLQDHGDEVWYRNLKIRRL